MGWMLSGLACALLVSALLAGCSSISIELPRLFLPATATVVPSVVVFPSATPPPPAPQATSTPLTGTSLPGTAVPTPVSEQKLIIWLPSQFDPAGDNIAAGALRQRLAAFESENPGVKIEVRVKAASGPGGLLEALSTASAAAPDAVPALIAVSRTDLESAALKGLVFSLDGLTQIMEDTDWYTYARQLSQIQGSTFGLPFAGDALVLVYRPARLGPPPASWDALMRLGQPVVFPVTDPQGLFSLTLYRMLDGSVQDDQRRPVLQPDVLSKALKLYAEGAQQGVFPYWLAQIQTERQAWQAYHDGRAQWLVTWGSTYLTELPADSVPMALPALGEKPLTLATGWVWALSDPLPERRALAARLAEYLVQPDFLAGWSASVRLLPPRPSSLSTWKDASLRGIFHQVALSAELRPANDLMSALGPALENATSGVIKREIDPGPAAQNAAERLQNPATK